MQNSKYILKNFFFILKANVLAMLILRIINSLENLIIP